MISRFNLLNARIPHFTSGDCVSTVWVLCGAEWGLSGCCQGLSETHEAPAAKHMRHTSQVNKKLLWRDINMKTYGT